MKKIISLFIGLLFLGHCYSQTIKITKISLTPAQPIKIIDYVNSDINLTDDLAPYSATKIFFTWSNFNPASIPANTPVIFTLWINDGFTETNGNSINQFINVNTTNGSSEISIAANFIINGSREYTIKATFIDNNGNENTLTESGSWSVNIITAPKQILNNTLCCSQNTFAYPFDPILINQATSTTVSTEDGALITSIQWQKFANNIWSNISGATQMSYDPPSTSVNVKFRRVLQSASGASSISNEISITKIAEVISGNSICCSQTTPIMPFYPTALNQSANTTLSSNIPGTNFTYQWQDSTNGIWANITGETNSLFNPTWLKNNKYYRRVVISSNGNIKNSNKVSIILKPCDRPADQQNLICGDQTFYRVQNGDKIDPAIILGAFINPNINRREFGFDYMMSYDGSFWFNVKPKHLLCVSGSNTDCAYSLCYGEDQKACAIRNNELDYQIQSFTFDINKGLVQHIYIKRDYYHWYDPFNCSIWNFPPLSCGAQWHFQSSSNIATITITTSDFPKPVPRIVSSKNSVNCIWGEQTITFNIPQLNNGEYYKWSIPSTWTLNNTFLEGPYVNQISVNTNSGDADYAKGGEVCLEVTQGSQTDRQCINIAGSSPTTIDLPATIRGCEGETVVIKPTLKQNNTVMNPANYDFSWSAYQSPNIICGNPALNNCKQLTVNISNVQQNPTQAISLIVRDNLGCRTSASTTLSTTPGWQMGILNSYNDPVAKSTSTLSLDETNNFLYFVRNNGSIYRSYFDNTLNLWQYVELKNKTTNTAIKSDGAVAAYRGATNKIFYVYNNYLYYAESTDNSQSWIDYSPNFNVAQNVDARIKVDGNNIYYINTSGNNRQVYYKSIINLNVNNPAILVGNVGMNYSQSMFTVEDGILTYADQSGNIVAFNAITGSSYSINVPAATKQVSYNSNISIYSGNIYYANSTGSLIILKRNVSSGIYDNYEEIKNLQLAGTFAINKQTGTVYAKTHNVAGKQIYYLNGIWQTAPIQNYTSAYPIQSGMIYGNGHAFYISSIGLLSNTFYIEPCIPAVLRTSGNTYSQTGDILNDPLSNEVNEDHTMLIYPNPTNSQIKVTFTIPEESTIRINIIPITGGTSDVLSNKIMESGTQELNLDLSNYNDGVYLIQLYVNETIYNTSKAIKF